MKVVQIKEELYNYIESADTRLLKMLLAVAQTYIREDYTLPGPPMDRDTLRSRIKAAKARIEEGKFTTQEDLESEMEKW
ncbi:MAG: hypothetical protein OEW75_10350 [Cyclobacteriaceae bacterium]|nr:hypothetical protein [Cyclobacteriaceae bacterium]